jgi:pilus assembly protein CpaB
MQRKLAVIIAVVLGLLAVFLTNVYFQQKEGLIDVRKTRVLVAAKDISKGTTIDYDMLAFKTIPLNFVQPKAISSKESAVGKTTLVTILSGEQILSTKLTAPGSGLTLAGKTPPGKRAFTIGLDAAAAVGGMVDPGDHVDILAVFTNPAVTLTLFQDVLVLAVGRQMVPTQERGDRETSVSAVKGITLALTPQEVQVITVAIQHGKIKLTLRPRMEEGRALPPANLANLPAAIDLNTLLQLYVGRPEAARAVPQVEVIRGLKKEVTAVPAARKR